MEEARSRDLRHFYFTPKGAEAYEEVIGRVDSIFKVFSQIKSIYQFNVQGTNYPLSPRLAEKLRTLKGSPSTLYFEGSLNV